MTFIFFFQLLRSKINTSGGFDIKASFSSVLRYEVRLLKSGGVFFKKTQKRDVLFSDMQKVPKKCPHLLRAVFLFEVYGELR